MANLSISSGVTPTKGRKVLILIGTIAVLAVVATVLIVWRQVKQGDAAGWGSAPVQVAATQVQKHSLGQSLQAIGSLTAVQQVQLAPEVEGRIVQLAFESGAQVQQGDLLVQLFDAPEQADLAQANAALNLAQAHLKRGRELAPIGALAKETLDQRSAEVTQAKARVQQAQARLLQKQIRAPFSGVLGVRQANLGEYLTPGQEVISLTDLSRLYVNFSLPQQALQQAKIGASVALKSDAYPDQTFYATVSAVEPWVDASTRNLKVQAVLENKALMLRPGIFVEVALAMPDQQDVLLIPATAVQLSAFGDSVLVIRGEHAIQQGTAESVQVTVGRRMGDKVVIEKGLQAGDVVITKGQLRVQPGAVVEVTEHVAVTAE